jgi:hypothetical protein
MTTVHQSRKENCMEFVNLRIPSLQARTQNLKGGGL